LGKARGNEELGNSSEDAQTKKVKGYAGCAVLTVKAGGVTRYQWINRSGLGAYMLPLRSAHQRSEK
jgi:hypothetical protein